VPPPKRGETVAKENDFDPARSRSRTKTFRAAVERPPEMK
jgi:hypothetical protein